MKKLVCEMCGGADLVKQDGVFVCQNCGTKYSVEEARKMMMEGSVSIEGTVSVDGVVKVDKSEELKKLYTLARRAKKSDNTENAVRYYTQIEMQDPDSWEAYFYLIYFKARTTTVGNIPTDCKNLSNCFSTVLDLLTSSVPNDDECVSVLEAIIEDLHFIGKIMISSAKGLNDVRKSASYLGSILSMVDSFGDAIISTIPNLSTVAVQAWKMGIELYVTDICFGGKYIKEYMGPIGAYGGYLVLDTAKKIYDIDPNYEDPFGVAEELHKNEKILTCPKCGTSFRERESQCPQCGCSKEEVEKFAEEQRIQAEKEAEEARIRAEKEAEERRIQAEKEAEERRIQAEKEAEEARIRAEQEAAEQAARRKERWQKNKTKVFVGIFIFIGAIIAAIFVVKYQAKVKQEKANIMAMQAFDAADSCMRVNNFDKAEEYYRLALEYANDEFLIERCCICLTELDAERESYQYRHKKSKVNRTNTTLTNAELWEDFESAYIRYYGITSLNASTYSVAKKNIQNFLYAGKKEGADISRILTDYSSDWKWLGDYIQEVNGTQITSEIRWRFSVVAFFLANEGDSRYNVDFSWAGEPEAWRSAYQDAQ
jgi:hypothetical protein